MFEQEQQHRINRVQPLFYFKFEMRLEFIPFIEQEIKEFIAFSQQKINSVEHIPQILAILNKRIRDIDRFYDQNWSDYRTQQILRSRQFLLQFCKQNHAKLSQIIVAKKAKLQQNSAKPNTPSYPVTPLRSKTEISSSKFDKNISPVTNKKQAKQISKADKAKQSSIIKSSQFSLQKIKRSTSRSISKDNSKLTTPLQNKASPKVISPAFQSPILSKSSLSKGKPLGSPSKIVKKIESPVQKKVAPVRKLTKQQYIAHLRNKKLNS